MLKNNNCLIINHIHSIVYPFSFENCNNKLNTLQE
jgi:hypothetical protein